MTAMDRPPHAGAGRNRRKPVPKAIMIWNFRLHFAGSMVSIIGTWMQLTGQAWLVLQLTGSPLSLAIVTSLQFLPVMLLSLIGGAIADRYTRRRLMILTQSLGAVQAGLTGLLCASGSVTIWQVYAMATALGLINALDLPLRQAFTGELVPPAYLPNAIAMNSLSQNLGRIIGPAIGGLVIAALGVSATYFINALTFGGALLALVCMRAGDLQPRRAASPQPLFGQVREAMVYARGTPAVLFLLIATAFIGLFGQNFATIVPLISTFLVHASPAEFGVLNSCLGSGSFIAAAVMTTRGAPSTQRILLAGTVFGAGLVAISFSTQLVLSGAIFVFVGAAAVTFSASMQTSLQLWAPPEMRGRLASIVSLLVPSPIGPILTGAAATTFGVPLTVLMNGLLCCAGIGMAYAFLRYHRRRGTLFVHRDPTDAA